MDGLFRPYLIYNHSQAHLYPSVPAEDYREPGAMERFDHVAANGKTLSYQIGARDFIEARFPWQTDAKVGEKTAPATGTWWHWWQSVRGGAKFYFCSLDTVPIINQFTIGTSVIIGEGDTGAKSIDRYVKMDMQEFIPEREDVHGYWSIVIRLREAVL